MKGPDHPGNVLLPSAEYFSTFGDVIQVRYRATAV